MNDIDERERRVLAVDISVTFALSSKSYPLGPHGRADLRGRLGRAILSVEVLADDGDQFSLDVEPLIEVFRAWAIEVGPVGVKEGLQLWG